MSIRITMIFPEFETMQRFATLDVPMCQPIEIGIYRMTYWKIICAFLKPMLMQN